MPNEKLKFSQPEISKEILLMRDHDQKLRGEMTELQKKDQKNSEKYRQLVQRVIEKDTSNRERLKVIIDSFGWPNDSMVGRKAGIAAWVIVNHADRDPLFQIRCLPLLKEEVDKGEAESITYAYLYDRLQLAHGKKQLYATQTQSSTNLDNRQFQPILDEALVQERRTQIGFNNHISEEAEGLGFTYVLPSHEEAIAKEQNYQSGYDEQIELAHKALNNHDHQIAANHYKIAAESGLMSASEFVQTARCISLAQDENSERGSFYLMKAVLKGWKDMDAFETDSDFQFIREANQSNWNCLLRLISEIKNNNKQGTCT